MTRVEALRLMRKVWGFSQNMERYDYLQVERVALEGETVLDTLHRVADWPKPDPEICAPYTVGARQYYQSLDGVIARLEIEEAKARRS